MLSNLDVRTIIGNFNLTFNNFLENVFKYYDVAFPIVLRKIKQLPTAPWMTPSLRQCIKLYRMYLKVKITRGDYTYYRNRLTSVFRRVKRLYYTKLLFDAANDHVKLWNCLNNVVERMSVNQ